jgi:hypothetical protein
MSPPEIYEHDGLYIVLIVIMDQIDKFNAFKNLKVCTQTKIYRHSWKQRAKISITAKFEEEIS